MKNRVVKALVMMMAASTLTMVSPVGIYAEETEAVTEAASEAGEEDADQAAADNVAALIDKIYVQERTDTTDADCTAAKEAWDALTDAQKELVEGEGYQGHRGCTADSLSGLGSKKSIYCTDHHQPCTGKRR